MSFIEIKVFIAGVLTVVLAILHVPQIWHLVFPNWKKEIDITSRLNRQLANTVLMALTFSLLVFGLLSIIYAKEISKSVGLAWGLNLSYSFFWLWRLVWQVIYFRVTKREHGIKLLLFHYSLIVIFTILFSVYISLIIWN